MKVCIIGASGKLGQYMAQHALAKGYQVVGVCRAEGVAKLDRLSGRIAVLPGATDGRDVISRAVAGCDAVLTVLVPRGVHHYAWERPKQRSTTHSPVHHWSSRTAGTSHAMPGRVFSEPEALVKTSAGSRVLLRREPRRPSAEAVSEVAVGFRGVLPIVAAVRAV
jgi:uncharacterized protein YbjT (DUF2867 family)